MLQQVMAERKGARGADRDRTRENSDEFEESILECLNTWLGYLLSREGERERGLMREQ